MGKAPKENNIIRIFSALIKKKTKNVRPLGPKKRTSVQSPKKHRPSQLQYPRSNDCGQRSWLCPRRLRGSRAHAAAAAHDWKNDDQQENPDCNTDPGPHGKANCLCNIVSKVRHTLVGLAGICCLAGPFAVVDNVILVATQTQLVVAATSPAIAIAFYGSTLSYTILKFLAAVGAGIVCVAMVCIGTVGSVAENLGVGVAGARVAYGSIGGSKEGGTSGHQEKERTGSLHIETKEDLGASRATRQSSVG